LNFVRFFFELKREIRIESSRRLVQTKLCGWIEKQTNKGLASFRFRFEMSEL
jgi:hypothetical protein